MKDGTASDELAELACMSALARWLTRWQPIHIHRAILAGAKPEAVAAALGGSFGLRQAQATEPGGDNSHRRGQRITESGR
jgi:hypothetical protein